LLARLLPDRPFIGHFAQQLNIDGHLGLCAKFDLLIHGCNDVVHVSCQ
jgi:hypothetical protein